MEQKKLTSEELARVFAAYMPCFGKMNNEKVHLIGVLWGEGEISYAACDQNGEVDHDALVEFGRIEKFTPELKPLSAITDEDAVGLADLAGVSRHGQTLSHSMFNREFCILSFSDGETTRVSKIIMFREYYDYLRSKGYDCGYGSITSLIEAGIAIESAPNVQVSDPPRRTGATDGE